MPECEKFPAVSSALGSAALAGRQGRTSLRVRGKSTGPPPSWKREVAAFIKPTQTDEGLQLACEYEF
jgi:hypothetical protein